MIFIAASPKMLNIRADTAFNCPFPYTHSCAPKLTDDVRRRFFHVNTIHDCDLAQTKPQKKDKSANFE